MCSAAQVAQSVEQRTENPRVDGSIPPLGTMNSKGSDLIGAFFMPDDFVHGLIPAPSSAGSRLSIEIIVPLMVLMMLK